MHFQVVEPARFGIFGTYLNQGSHSKGCRTQAWAWAQATADSAWAGMAAVCRRKVCGAAPQDVELLKALDPADGALGPAELHAVGLDREGPNRRSGAR